MTKQFAFMDEPDDAPPLADDGILWRIASAFGIKRSAVQRLPLLNRFQSLLNRFQSLESPSSEETASSGYAPMRWGNAGIGGPGLQPATFGVPESPVHPVESSLADVLEPDDRVSPDHFLNVGQQVRILSRLAWYKQWKSLRTLNEGGFPPEAIAEYEANHRQDTPSKGSRSLDLAEITRRLEQSGQ